MSWLPERPERISSSAAIGIVLRHAKDLLDGKRIRKFMNLKNTSIAIVDLEEGEPVPQLAVTLEVARRVIIKARRRIKHVTLPIQISHGAVNALSVHYASVLADTVVCDFQDLIEEQYEAMVGVDAPPEELQLLSLEHYEAPLQEIHGLIRARALPLFEGLQ